MHSGGDDAPEGSAQGDSDPMTATMAEPRRWDLGDLYASTADWHRERAELVARVEALERLRRVLGESPVRLREALDEIFELERRLETLQAYAHLLSDENLRDSDARGLRQMADALLAEFRARTAWLAPELLDLGPDALERAVAAEPSLRVYRRFFERLERRRSHTLDPDGERIAGLAEATAGDGAAIAGLMRDAEMPWPEIAWPGGGRRTIDPATFARERSHPDRSVRRAVFTTYFTTLSRFRETFASALYATVKHHVFRSRVRGYGSCLESALDRNEVDPEVYRTLIAEVRRGIPLMERYFALRREALGLDEIAYWDLHCPLVAEVRLDCGWDAARRAVVDAVRPLGDDYVERLERAFASRWIDVDPRPGKRTGAYVNDSAYGVHPYMLLNHQDDFASLTTLAHEAGHLMHSLYSQQRQPYPTARYVIFVAEVASILNEQLLLRDRLDRAADDDEELMLLGRHLDTIRGTLFRQTMFAEFEWTIHQKVEAGEPLTGASLSASYLDLLRRYHAAERASIRIDEVFGAEWIHIPHLHYDFYVYQYATSYVAATALCRAILAGRDGARQRYLELLAAGSTRPPIELLRDAGVDMTSPEPFRATLEDAGEALDRMEALVRRRRRLSGDRRSRVP